MIKEFIKEHLRSILKDHSSLVIYDARHLYAELLPELKDDKTEVFDISVYILSVREDALDYFNQVLPTDKNSRMIIYVPFAPPETKQDKINDPFFNFTLGGSYFPFDANDKYESLCKACFKDKEEQINTLFESEIPDFDTIDALGGGNTWAKLQTVTEGKSEKEIFIALMTPTILQIEKFNKDKAWQKEYKELAKTIGLIIKERSFDNISYELWRFILFSEFVFDLPIELPEKLKSVAVANLKSKTLILEICRSLRNNKTSEDIYIEKAEEVANELGLSSTFKNKNNLGEIITFSFEDNTYFFNFISLLLEGKTSEAHKIIESSQENIWLHHDEEKRRYWKIAELGYNIIDRIKNAKTNSTTLKALIDSYSTELYKTDQLQRKFEKEFMEVLQPTDTLLKLVKMVRNSYSTFTEKTQKIYQDLFIKENWPVSGMFCNTEVFKKHLQPLIKSNTKTAYLLVDALRFELGKELEEFLEKHFDIQVIPSCAYVPTVTKFGMAALLPEADKHLKLEQHESSLESIIGEKLLLNLTDRKKYLKDKLGDRCEIISLDNLISNSSTNGEDLLIVTTNEIDIAGENLATNCLHTIKQSIQKLVKAIYHLSQSGYAKIVIATDHGFVLHPNFQPGDNVKKPNGEWIMSKSRSLAGHGVIPEYSLVFTPEQIGVRSSVKNFVFLKGYAVFEKNTFYFHEGLSLQENIVPVITLSKIVVKNKEEININITYKGKTTGVINSRRPSFEIASFVEGKLGFEPIIIRLEAISKEKLVGLPSSDEKVNDTTKLIEIIPSQTYKITLDMDVDFEGEFEVRLTDPVSNKMYSSITLKTDYIS